MLIGGNPTSIPLPFNECVVPEGINGPVAIWVTSDGQPLINNLRDRSTAQLVAGPTYAFIDTQPQTLGQVARGAVAGSGSTGATESTSTRTISPDEASSILANATPTASATDSAVDGAATDAAATTLATDPAVTDSAAADPAATGAASASDSAAAPAGTAASANNASSGVAGGPNTFVVPSKDGSLTVLGWSNV